MEAPACSYARSKILNAQVKTRHVDVSHVAEHTIDVEVPERTFHTVLKYEPSYQHESVDVVVEVPEIHCHEQLNLVEGWEREEFDVQLPRIHTREILKPNIRHIHTEVEEVVDVPIPLSRIETIIERPDVFVREKIEYVKARGDIQVHTSEALLDVTHVVQVPRIVPVQKVEHRHNTKEVVIRNVNCTANIVEDPHEVIIEKTIDVPQIHTTRHIRYVPKFIQSSALGSQDMVELENALQEARADIAQLENDNREMRTRLGESLVVLSSKKNLIDEEKRQTQILKELIRATSSYANASIFASSASQLAPAPGTLVQSSIANSNLEHIWSSKLYNDSCASTDVETMSLASFQTEPSLASR